MPSYFYHLAIDLFSRPQSELNNFSKDPSLTTLSFDSACEALLPFQNRSSSSTARNIRHQSYNKYRRDSPDFPSEIRNHPAPNVSPSSPPSASPYTKSPISALELEKDLRLDKVFIECIDMIPSVTENPVTTGIGTDILGGLRTKGQYFPLDHKTSESAWGVVHLYRDAQETPYLVADDHPAELKGSSAAVVKRSYVEQELGRGVGSSSRVRPRGIGSALQPEEDCTTLCVLAVPSYMSASDFLGFVGEATMDDVSHFRMIRTARANRYMVLMKFRSWKKARDWQREWNGKVFNSMEPETCHVVFVKTVEIQGVESDSQNTMLAAQQTSLPSHTTGSQPAALGSASLSTKPLAPPTPSLIELPTCPVCLERMDETTGLLTIICQHVFHCTCLQKWKGSGCPVCRYTQDEFRKPNQGVPLDDTEPAECSTCHSDINLWICLICGNVGCGRYDSAHAFAHYSQTSHAFAMDLSTQRVWDYVGDAYVHRIIQSKTDGKLVELPAADNSALDPPDWADAVPREKLENMSVEYTHLLTSQLESQRAYFEGILERAVDKASQASVAAASAQEAADTATGTLRSVETHYDKLCNETVPSLERDKTRAEKRADKFETMARKMEREWREEKTINESLMERIEHLTAEVEALKAANIDLTEQNRDLTFFISGSEKLKDQGEEVVQGTVSVPDPPSASKKKGKGKRK
ncbi:BRCA1-associated protein 2-domain-containing protein [Aspergillus pseudoustus]|uniref:BRCA1-associated protein 2-domain-containing protein n=1 Tax=Aspergillus pseudoustus TaxID=1810923 RepID=A0ABR4IYF1_9EURO